MWALMSFWNIAARASKAAGCTDHPAIVVHSPLRHVNCHDLGSVGNPCVRKYLEAECFPLSSDESAVLAREFGSTCKRGQDGMAWQGARMCTLPANT